MLPKIDKKTVQKTVKIVAQVATFISISVCLNAAFNNYISPENANKIAYRVGKAVIYLAAVNVGVDGVGKLLDDVFAEDETLEQQNTLS